MIKPTLSHFLRPLLFATALTALLPATSRATERRFTNVYEVTTIPKGTLEIENWVTWKTRHDEGEGGDQFDFRHEFEYGVTDRLLVSLYVADWSLVDDSEHDRSARYHDTAVEAIYNLTNPVTDFLGSAVYGEVTVGDRLFAVEGKLLLQKNVGPWLFAYNAVIEAEFEGAHLDEQTGEFQQTAGISYQVIPQLTVGAEVVHEVEFPNWESANDPVVFAGPNVSFRGGNAFVTITPLIQLTDVKEEPEFETRLIFGVHF